MADGDGQEQSAPAVSESVAAPASGGDNYLATLAAEADAAFAALESAPAPKSEATTEDPAGGSTVSTEAVADAPALDSVDAQLAGNDDEVITRRNARELVEKARAEKEEALSRAAKAEQEKADADAREAAQQARYQELAQTWGNSAELSQQLERAIAREDWTAIDAVAEKFGLSNPSIADARALLVQLDEQTTRNGELYGFWRQAFMGNTGLAWKAMYDKDGIDKAILDSGDIGKSLEHIYEAGGKAKLAEVQGEIDALKAENRALKARAGSLTPSPESGGNGATSAIPRTPAELERMGLKEFEKSFDRILQAIP